MRQDISSQFRFPHQGSKSSRVAHSRLVNLIFVIYWLLIFEGALRKWVAPELKNYIFFVRMPFVLSVYGLAFHYGQWPKASRILQVTYIMAFISVILAIVQLGSGGYDSRYLLIAVYGWINYFLYIPLAFIISRQFGKEEINRLIRQTLWIAVASAPLVIMQYNASASDLINQGSGIDEEYIFHNLGSGMGLVRPFGFFTSTLGQQMFVASCIALTLATWLTPKHARQIKNTLLIPGTLASLVMLVLSQSRGLFFNVALILLAAGLGAWVSGNQRLLVRVVILPTLLIPAALVLWIMVFPIAFEAFSERLYTAWEHEAIYYRFGIFSRAFTAFYSFVDYIESTPFFGFLLGIGGNAARLMAWVDLPKAAYSNVGAIGWGENGWDRHIIELGPILGCAYILFRIGLTCWLSRIVLQKIRHTKNPTAILMFGFVGIMLLSGQITGHGTVNGYTWLFVGFCVAATKVSCNSYGDRPMIRRN